MLNGSKVKNNNKSKKCNDDRFLYAVAVALKLEQIKKDLKKNKDSSLYRPACVERQIFLHMQKTKSLK